MAAQTLVNVGLFMTTLQPNLKATHFVNAVIAASCRAVLMVAVVVFAAVNVIRNFDIDLQ